MDSPSPMRPASFAAAAAALAAGLALSASSPALADITHVVGRGHTIEAIAHRYHVSEKSIIDANHLKDAKHLKPGQTLIIPGVEPRKKVVKGEKGEKPEKDEKGSHKVEKGEPGPRRARPARPPSSRRPSRAGAATTRSSTRCDPARSSASA